MAQIDEETLRKAATWQDFKEAQGLHKIGAVTEATPTKSGWNGTVKSGKRSFRVSVEKRTATWFDATCPCAASKREGRFCPHAIAIALQIIEPVSQENTPQPPTPEASPNHQAPAEVTPEAAIPEIAWEIKFQGPWQTNLQKARLSAALKVSDQDPTPSDQTLTQWLLKNQLTSGPNIQLSLAEDNIPSFLKAIERHPSVSSNDSEIHVESGLQYTPAKCELVDDQILIHPSNTPIFILGGHFWTLSAHQISQIGDNPVPSFLSPHFKALADGKSTSIDVPSFLNFLETLENFLDFSNSPWFQSLSFKSLEPDVRVVITGSEKSVRVTLSTSYSQPLPHLSDNTILTASQNPIHNPFTGTTFPPSTESQILRFQDPTSISDLFTKIIREVPPHWHLEKTPEIETLQLNYAFISPHIEILTNKNDFREFKLLFQTDDGKGVDLAEVRRILRSGNQAAHKTNISPNLENLIDPLFADLNLSQENGRFTSNGAQSVIIDEIYKKLQVPLQSSQEQPFIESNDIELPRSIKAELRPYQLIGFQWLNDRLNQYSGALLADDMGLGKTLQAISAIEHSFQATDTPKPALVVMTTSLLGNWLAEFTKFSPQRHVVTLHGAGRDKHRAKITPQTVVLTTYATLARDLAFHLRQEYSIAVIDEASLIRNPDTDHSKAVAKLNADARIALTGTPIENSAQDLWSIFRFIQPGWLGDRSSFAEKYQKPSSDREGNRNTLEILRLKTSPFVLRRTKSEVAPDLPSKIQIDEICTLSKDQLSVYKEIKDEGLRKVVEIESSGTKAAARMATLTTLLRLRQTCCDLALLGSDKLAKLPIPRRSGKLERFFEILTQSIASGSRILVFSQFRKQLDEIGAQLQKAQLPYLQLDGSTRNRQEIVTKFQDASGPPVFLISLKAGGYGLNLTAADVVIHYDPWWNPAAEAQATDRAHRIGQTKPVTVYRLLTKNTVEEKVVQLQNTKRELAEALDETSTPSDAPSMSAADLKELLR